MKKPLALIIMDGFGDRREESGNAIRAASTPNLDRIFAQNPRTDIGASGMDVGLPEGQMGNSEVGHTNIGAGRVVYQELTRITKAIDEGTVYQNPVLTEAMESAKAKGTALHLMGLLSDGGVHSHQRHLYGLLEMAKRHGLQRVYIHCFMDGRDTPPSSGKDYIQALLRETERIGAGRIATISGRYYAMDRDNRWERVEKAYDAMVNGRGTQEADPVKVMADSYAAGVTDEFVVPTVCDPAGTIGAEDSVVFINFRPDRAREITRSLVDPEFAGFAREKGLLPLCYVCMTQYDATMPGVRVAFPPQSLKDTFGQYISDRGLTQLRIAETEKYAHVTFFFNGGVEAPCPGEDRALIPSPKVATYDLKPEMSAFEVTDEVIGRLESGKYDVIILNYANCDMVGHTGVFEAAVKAVETVDQCVGRMVAKIQELGGAALITADHGNADQMWDEEGKPFTAHTTNPVPFVAVGTGAKALRDGGRLADIAPTMLEVLGLPQPQEMDGRSLLVK
ncbi:MAG: 2,3-bisphosphoglycerate-independent phosphoglycerate mutase [Angelakisella sp.]|jgi:2,3-bisphosphoglycerate-independent phosphoglycerate mutase|nr:2,3-bisphosphoglycerate-independent phosphoglycerate mutase [Angelakisella sp.]MCI9528979.1 2,3-bisphosphoglycerate-independent phosphoglycerate mutase [Angelakisella sp.]